MTINAAAAVAAIRSRFISDALNMGAFYPLQAS
jgi:hypothetical protein